LFCAILCGAISFIRKNKKRPDVSHWLGLATLFLFLSIDEACEIHETITGLIRLKVHTTGVLYSAWIIPYGILLILFLAIYLRFWFRLPEQTKKLCFLAGFVYVSGALGFEIIGELFEEQGLHNTFAVLLCITMEEFLEMIGIVILIYALLSYIRSELGDEPLHLKFS
jgi:hypothetical protein